MIESRDREGEREREKGRRRDKRGGEIRERERERKRDVRDIERERERERHTALPYALLENLWVISQAEKKALRKVDYKNSEGKLSASILCRGKMWEL